MAEGHFATHLRRMREIYRERHEAFREAAARRLGGLLDGSPTDTGLHTVGRLPGARSEADIAQRALARQITASPLGGYCISPISVQGFVLGFSGVKPDDAEARCGDPRPGPGKRREPAREGQ